MAKKKEQQTSWDAATLAAEEMYFQDETTSIQAEQEKKEQVFVPLSLIKLRENDTRNLNPEHVENLAESIAVIGLLEPLVTDEKYRLLAGGHRLAAIQLLKENQPQIYAELFSLERIPIRIMPFDAEEDPGRALQCEVAENEHRRDYTPKEVKELAQRLKEAGYTDSPHRPKKGEKALVPALKVIVGKSRRSIMRYLSAENDNRESVPPVTLNAETKALQKIQKGLSYLNTVNPDKLTTPKLQEIAKKAPRFLKLIDAALAEIGVIEMKDQT
ncbi:MAG: ParB N-terminal domain-containing protein [Xenococcus sp. MO_188.B8]|nr:ParB N-terminal domain-containing protein [Xenococcus sp. MO_188.B8]